MQFISIELRFELQLINNEQAKRQPSNLLLHLLDSINKGNNPKSLYSCFFVSFFVFQAEIKKFMHLNLNKWTTKTSSLNYNPVTYLNLNSASLSSYHLDPDLLLVTFRWKQTTLTLKPNSFGFSSLRTIREKCKIDISHVHPNRKDAARGYIMATGYTTMKWNRHHSKLVAANRCIV